MSDDKIRVILVDDEPLALRGLRHRLAEFAEIEIVAECANGRAAVKELKAHSSLLSKLGAAPLPEGTAVTAIWRLLGLV